MKQASAGTTGFETSQTIRISQAARVRAVDGIKFDRLVKKNDLVGTWQGADPNRCYCGLVPVIGGIERYDLALTSFDLTLGSVIDFTKSVDAGEVLNLNCPVRDAAIKALQSPDCTYDSLIDSACAVFPTGGTIKAISYTAKTKKGGTWRNYILSFGA